MTSLELVTKCLSTSGPQTTVPSSIHTENQKKKHHWLKERRRNVRTKDLLKNQPFKKCLFYLFSVTVCMWTWAQNSLSDWRPSEMPRSIWSAQARYAGLTNVPPASERETNQREKKKQKHMQKNVCSVVNTLLLRILSESTNHDPLSLVLTDSAGSFNVVKLCVVLCSKVKPTPSSSPPTSHLASSLGLNTS